MTRLCVLVCVLCFNLLFLIPSLFAQEQAQGDRPPFLKNYLTRVTVPENSPPLFLNLRRMFADPDSPPEALTLQARVISTGVTPLLRIQLKEKQLKLHFLKETHGEATILITATSEGKKASAAFKVTVLAPVLLQGGAPKPLVIQEDSAALGFRISRLFQLKNLAPGKDRFSGITVSLKSNPHPQRMEATLKDNILMIQPKPNQTGSLTLTLEGRFRSQTLQQQILVEIQAVDDPPFVTQELKPTQLNLENPETILDLSTLFSDVDDEDAAIQVEVTGNDSPQLLNAVLGRKKLKLSVGKGKGKATLHITGTSGKQSISYPYTVAVDALSQKTEWHVTLALTPAASVTSSESVLRGTSLGISKEEQGTGVQLEVGRSLRDWIPRFQAWSVFLQVNQTSFSQAVYQTVQVGAEWDLAQEFKTGWGVLPYVGLTYGSGSKEWQEPPFGVTGNASDSASAKSTVSGIHLGASYPFNRQWSAGLRHQYLMMDFNTQVAKDFDEVSQIDSTMQSTMLLLKYQF